MRCPAKALFCGGQQKEGKPLTGVGGGMEVCHTGLVEGTRVTDILLDTACSVQWIPYNALTTTLLAVRDTRTLDTLHTSSFLVIANRYIQGNYYSANGFPPHDLTIH